MTLVKADTPLDEREASHRPVAHFGMVVFGFFGEARRTGTLAVGTATDGIAPPNIGIVSHEISREVIGVTPSKTADGRSDGSFSSEKELASGRHAVVVDLIRQN